MKKWKLGILVTLTALLTVVGLFASQTNVKAASKTITVGTTAQTYPNTYQFSNTFAYYAAQVAVPKDSSVKSLKDLEGKTVSATLGSSNIALLKAYDSKIKIKTYDDRNAIFTDANNGTVAGVLNQRQFLQQTIKKQNLNLRIVKGVAGWNNEAYPFQKSSEGTALKKKFNQALKELKADGTISKLSKQYYGEDVTKKSVDD